MKYLKTFETHFYGIYYKIFIDGSIDKFLIALKKLGYYEDFHDEWKDWQDVHEDSVKYFKKDILYLLIGKHYSGKPMFIVRSDDSEFRVEGKYMGEIHIEDYEVESDKYNL